MSKGLSLFLDNEFYVKSKLQDEIVLSMDQPVDNEGFIEIKDPGATKYIEFAEEIDDDPDAV